MLKESHFYFHKAADVVGVPSKLRDIVLSPVRVVKVEIVTEADDGKLLHHMGYRVQHNRSRGPMKGGLRYHPSVETHPKNSHHRVLSLSWGTGASPG